MKINSFYIILIGLFIFSSCLKDQTLIGTKVENHFFLENKGAKMMVNVEGNTASKTFLVMLHGGPGGNSAVYNTLALDFSEPLEERYGVVYWDQRGSGNSSGVYKKEDLTVNQFVEDLDKLLILLRHRYGADISIFLLGHSWGGGLGSAYLTSDYHDGSINGWIDVDGVHNFPLLRAAVLRQFLDFAPTQIAANNNKKNWQEVLDYCQGLKPASISNDEELRMNSYGHQSEGWMIEDDLINKPDVGIGDLLDYTYFSYHNPNTALINSLFTGSVVWGEARNENFTSALENVTIPGLFLWGKHDMVVPVELGEEAFEHYGSEDKMMFVFENSAHSPMINEPAAFNQTLIAFMEAHR